MLWNLVASFLLFIVILETKKFGVYEHYSIFLYDIIQNSHCHNTVHLDSLNDSSADDFNFPHNVNQIR